MKVQIIPDVNGNNIRVSVNNPDYGYLRLQQTRSTFGNNGWVKKVNVSTLLHGKIEDLKDMGFATMKEITGKIVIREQTTPFSTEDRDLKIAGDTGIICSHYGEPIYRKTIFVADVTANDELVAHTNSEDIRNANQTTSSQIIANESFSSEEILDEVESFTL